MRAPALRSADFERVLGQPSRAKSPHFAVHHLRGIPCAVHKAGIHDLSTKLSTEDDVPQDFVVDEWLDQVRPIWMGTVIPKRHARRSVTRSLLKRHMREILAHETALPGGLWVIRLRAPFDRTLFPSAVSPALSRAVRDELRSLVQAAIRRSSASVAHAPRTA